MGVGEDDEKLADPDGFWQRSIFTQSRRVGKGGWGVENQRIVETIVSGELEMAGCLTFIRV